MAARSGLGGTPASVARVWWRRRFLVFDGSPAAARRAASARLLSVRNKLLNFVGPAPDHPWQLVPVHALASALNMRSTKSCYATRCSNLPPQLELLSPYRPLAFHTPKDDPEILIVDDG